VMPAAALDPAAGRLRNLKLAAAFGSDGTFMGHPAADVDAGGSN